MSYQEDNFTEIANAIRAKIGGGSIQATQFADKIGLINSDDAYTVRFIDYDGTVLKEQIVAPGGSVTPPTVTNKAATNLRPALTFQGWNHPQSEFYNVQCDIDAGAIYVPTDGKTHVYLRLNAATGFAIPLYLNKTDTSLMTVDWGDGTTSTSSASGNVSFTSNYASIGLKHITITGSGYKLGQGSTSTVFVGGSTQVYRDAIISAYIGSGCISLQDSSFYYCQRLMCATLMNAMLLFGYSHFSNCKSLKHITLPQSITTLPSSFLQSSFAIYSISLPYGMLTIGTSALEDCESLQSIAFPYTLTTIGAISLRYCYSIKKIVLHENISSIQNSCFRGLSALISVRIKCSISAYYGSYIFGDCFALNKIMFNNGVPQYIVNSGGFFYNCFAISDSIQIPAGATSIESGTFNKNYSRTFFNIPSSVTYLAPTAFADCIGLKYIIFNSQVPPTMGNINTFYGHNKACIYFVPDASLSAYQTATNWATYSNQIRPMSEFNINDFQ